LLEAARLLVLAATQAELGWLAEAEPEPDAAGWLRWRHGAIAAAISGIGKANAAARCASLLGREASAVEVVLLTGLAGGFGGLGPGQLVLASEEVDADLGTRAASGWEGLEALGFPSVHDHHNRIPVDPSTAAQIEGSLRSAGHAVTSCPFHTSDTVSGTPRMGAGRCERLGTRVESMEGSAVAAVCLRLGIPMAELRVVSNPIGRREPEAWDLPSALTALDQALRDLCDDWPWGPPTPQARGRISPERKRPQ
jgi:futalosine hydrolase